MKEIVAYFRKKRRPERRRAANPQLHNSGESSNITEALPWSNHTSADICKAQHLYFYLPWGESDCYNTSSAFTDILQTVFSLASQLWYGMTAEVNSNTRPNRCRKDCRKQSSLTHKCVLLKTTVV